MAKIQGPKEGKPILIFTKKSGYNLDPWAQKSTLRKMATPPSSPPPPPPTATSQSPSTSKWTRKDTRLRSLATRPVGAKRHVVHKADGPHRKKLRTYLGIVSRDKVDVTYENWKQVPTAQKDLIWEDIQAEFDIPEASDLKTKKKILQTVGSGGDNLTDKESADDTVLEKYDISKEKWAQFCLSRRDLSWEDVRKKAQAIPKQNTTPHLLSRGSYEYLENKLMEGKRNKKVEETAQSRSTNTVIGIPSPI
ncbi:hypothetical protein GmHk_01G001405 [Glycine max]|nr:hypothetical protein GmHk_01G001405 [Glycine max]